MLYMGPRNKPINMHVSFGNTGLGGQMGGARDDNVPGFPSRRGGHQEQGNEKWSGGRLAARESQWQ
jgi:hypothetical protein